MNMQSIYLYFIFSLVNKYSFLLRSKAVRASLNLEMYKKITVYCKWQSFNNLTKEHPLIFYVFQSLVLLITALYNSS